MTKFSEDVLAKIKGDCIAPVPRWHFLLKNYVLWGFFVVSIVLGSISFGVIEHIVRSGDFDLFDHLQGNVFTSTVMLLPYFWLLFLLVFSLVAFLNWKHTKKGYRFKRRWIIFGSFVLSIIFGNIFYVSGLGKRIDLLMVRAVPFYNESKHDARLILWQHPERGLLIGKITQIDSDQGTFVLEDGNGAKWLIDSEVQNKTKKQLQGIEQDGAIVKIIGSRADENHFVAKDVRSCTDCDGDNDDFGGADSDADGK